MSKFKVGDYVVVLKDRVEFLALIVSTPDDDEWDLELKHDEIGIEWQYEDVDDIDVIKVSDILRHAKSEYDLPIIRKQLTMSKELVAYKIIEEEIIRSINDGRTKRIVNLYKEQLQIIEEVLERNEPIPITRYHVFNFYTGKETFEFCPICKHTISDRPNFCPECGQRLKKEKEDE